MAILLLVFATWRLTSLIVNEEGPFDIFVKLRTYIGIETNAYGVSGGNNMIAKALTCIWCTSLWVSFLASFFSPYSVNIGWFIVSWLAISTGAILFDEVLSIIMRICSDRTL
jgi:hypothetical protein